MQSGKLNKRVIVQTVSKSSDGAGGSATDTWADTATVWAGFDAVDPSEQFEAGQQNTRAPFMVTMRYRTLTNAQRLKFGSRIFTINGIVNPGEKNEILQVMCEELPS